VILYRLEIGVVDGLVLDSLNCEVSAKPSMVKAIR